MSLDTKSYLKTSMTKTKLSMSKSPSPERDSNVTVANIQPLSFGNKTNQADHDSSFRL
jgi:hypothetical protein